MPITSLSDVTEFPLCWPEGKERCSERVRNWHFEATLAKAHELVRTEMRRWQAVDYILSMAPAYRRSISDPGVALWWTLLTDSALPELFVIACDQYTLVEQNLYAIGKTLNYLRGCERYGTYTMRQAVAGAKLFLPPPEKAGEIDWRAVLGALPQGIKGDDAVAIMNSRYRKMAAEANGDQDELRRLNLAIDKARRELAA